MLKTLLERSGVDMSNDEDLPKMLKQIDTWELERKLQKDMEENQKYQI